MSDESEAQRRARLDGAQIAFVAVLRELVRERFPNEQIRVGRRDRLCRELETAAGPDVDGKERDALRAATQMIASIFAKGRG